MTTHLRRVRLAAVAAAFLMLLLSSGVAFAAPTYSNLTPPSGAWLSASAPTFVARCDDPSGVMYSGYLYYDGALLSGTKVAATGPAIAPYLFTSIQLSRACPQLNGVHTVRALFYGNNGQPGPSTTWSFTVATTPTAASPSPAEGALLPTVLPTISALVTQQNGPFTPLLKVDGTVVPVTYNASTHLVTGVPAAPLADGVSHNAVLVLTDNALGIASTLSWSFTTSTHSTAVFSAESPAPGAATSTGRLALSAFADDPAPLTSATLDVDGARVPSTLTPAPGDATAGTVRASSLTLADGTHAATVTVVNSLGQVGTHAWTFTVAEPPRIDGLSPGDGSIVGSTSPAGVAFVSDNGAVSSVSVSVDGAGVTSSFDPGTGKVAFTSGPLSDEQTHTVTVSATDSSGNSAQATSSFGVQAFPDMADSADCTSCHKTFDTGAHPFAACDSCHGVGGPVRNLKHNWSGCGDCHPQYVMSSCIKAGCHPTVTAVTHRATAFSANPDGRVWQCTECHSVSKAARFPLHPAPISASHDTTSNLSACKPCHNKSLTREHSLHTDSATTRAMTCQSCHASSNPRVTAAITAGDGKCGSCHSIGVGHSAQHSAPVLDACSGPACHSGTVASVHSDVGCACHDSSDSAVVSAIANHDGSCTSCHDANAPHGDLNAIHAGTAESGPVDVWSDHRVVGSWIPWAAAQKTLACNTCHPTMNLLKLHGTTWDNCNVCHANGGPRKSFGTWDKSCQQGSCHPTLHNTAVAQASHATLGCFSRFGNGCHDDGLQYTACSSHCHDAAGVTHGDSTPPVTTPSTSDQGAVPGYYTWYRGTAHVTLTATDSASGVMGTYYRVNGGDWAFNPGTPASVVVTATGYSSVNYYSVDRFGNRETTGTYLLAVDNLAPVSTAQMYGAVNTWHVMPSDGSGSGVAARYYSFDGAPFALAPGPWWDYIVSGDNTRYGTHTFSYYSVDKVGNVEATQTATYDVPDPAGPTVQFHQSGYDQPYLLVTEDPRSPSGLDKVYYRTGSAFTAIDIPQSASPTETQRVDIPLPDGAQWLQWYATDKAGNSSAWGGWQSVRVDRNGPVITIDSVPQGDGSVIVTARAVDPGSGLLDWQPDALWQEQSYGDVITDNPGLWVVRLEPPAWGTRTYDIQVTARDNSYNESTLSKPVTLTGSTDPDYSPPETVIYDIAAGQTPTAFDDGAGGWGYEGELDSTDAESGVATIHYRVDGGDWSQEDAIETTTDDGAPYYYTEFYVAGLGPHTIEYYSVNQYGTAEEIKTTEITIASPE